MFVYLSVFPADYVSLTALPEIKVIHIHAYIICPPTALMCPFIGYDASRLGEKNRRIEAEF